VSRSRDRVGVVSPARSARSESLTPRVASRLLPRHPELVCECQDLLPRAPPRARFHKPEAPSTARSHRRARLSPASNRMGRHWYPDSSPRTQRPACVHAPTRGALDPTACRLFAGAEGPHAACQFLQCSVPRARHRTVRTPAEVWRATSYRMTTALSVRRQPSFLRPGVTWLA
jgi:hypothetical protein